MSRNENRDAAWLMIFAAALIAAFVLIPSFYAAKAGAINSPLLYLAKLQLKLFVPFSAEARKVWDHISGLDPAAQTWARMSAILSYTGKWVRWPLALFLTLFGCAAIFMGRIHKLIRRLDMESLLHSNAESFPCLRPIVGRGQYLLSPESYDDGHWRIARSPLQFAAEHGLLVDGEGKPFAPEQILQKGLGSTGAPAYGQARLDEAKAHDVLRAQLGPVHDGLSSLSKERKALAAAFLAYAGGDKKKAVALLDTLSKSYTENDGPPVCPALCDDHFQKRLDKVLKKHKAILTESAITRHNSFQLVWFMALLTRARKKGVLASSQFLFLRPLDRPLWYALNQCGGRAAWAEGFAPWAHSMAEEKAGHSLSEPKLEQAVKALRTALDAQGWLTNKPLPAKEPETAPGNPSPRPEPEIVFAPAEDNPEDEYDANEDPEIQRQQC